MTSGNIIYFSAAGARRRSSTRAGISFSANILLVILVVGIVLSDKTSALCSDTSLPGEK